MRLALLVLPFVIAAWCRPAVPIVDVAPMRSADVAQELHLGMDHLHDLVAAGSTDAAWAVERLQQAVQADHLDEAMRAAAHQGLALAYATGNGLAPDPLAAARHRACAVALLR